MLVAHVVAPAAGAGGRGCVSSRMEWDHDVPPFPIFIGEVARAEATLTFQARRRYRRLAA